LEGIVDTCLCGVLFWAFGFAFMFGSGNGFIGHEFFFLHGAPETYGSTGVAILAFWLFQFAFADTCSTITSGAMVGRTGFVGDLLYSFGVSGFIYPIIGHWAWGPDGWLNTIKPAAFHDFAGSTVVHTIGGFVALVSIDFVEWLRVDDPVGAVAVHGFCGIWGTLSLGLFATGQFGAPGPTGPDNSPAAVVTGLLYGGGMDQLIAQAIGSAAVTAATFAAGMILMYGVKATGTLRVSKDGELEGLDLHEHGGPAYAEQGN